MGTAAMLRIDHVMGLHRAYWVPEGFDATDGVYVHYRAPEFYAILNLESHRHQVRNRRRKSRHRAGLCQRKR